MESVQIHSQIRNIFSEDLELGLDASHGGFVLGLSSDIVDACLKDDDVVVATSEVFPDILNQRLKLVQFTFYPLGRLI